jgi:hypothetical protein
VMCAVGSPSPPRELSEMILRAQGRWEPIVAGYVGEPEARQA